jgi:hypothetical protein
MRRIYSIRLIVNARNIDDCEDADSLIEQIADLIDVGKLELGDCNPEHIAARMTDTRKALKQIVRKRGADR